MILTPPDYVVARFRIRVVRGLPLASESEQENVVRMLLEAWCEGAVAEEARSRCGTSIDSRD